MWIYVLSGEGTGERLMFERYKADPNGQRRHAGYQLAGPNRRFKGPGLPGGLVLEILEPTPAALRAGEAVWEEMNRTNGVQEGWLRTPKQTRLCLAVAGFHTRLGAKPPQDLFYSWEWWDTLADHISVSVGKPWSKLPDGSIPFHALADVEGDAISAVRHFGIWNEDSLQNRQKLTVEPPRFRRGKEGLSHWFSSPSLYPILWLSALYGVESRSLTYCKECGHYFLRSPHNRQRRTCDSCRKTAQSSRQRSFRGRQTDNDQLYRARQRAYSWVSGRCRDKCNKQMLNNWIREGYRGEGVSSAEEFRRRFDELSGRVSKP